MTDREILLEVLDVAKETRDTTKRTEAAVRALSEIMAREVSPLGQFRADVVRTLEEHFGKTAGVVLRLNEIEERLGDHLTDHRQAANGGE